MTGTADTTVPAFLGQDLFTSAREPKQLLVIEGGSHGAYDRAADSPYVDRMADFFSADLTSLNRS